MVINRIKLIDPPNHINEYLTHWTGRSKDDKRSFEILSKIIDSRKLKLAQNLISHPISSSTLKGEMICFTDTPIEQSLEHCKKYNYFGISFNKTEMMEYGANPVLYLVNSRREYQEFYTKQNFKNLFETNEDKILYSWIGSTFQPYDSGYSDFYEREWRIVRILPYVWIDNEIKRAGPYYEYPFKGDISRETFDNGTPHHQEFYISFDIGVVENIIVPTDYEKLAIELLNRNNLKCELILLEKKN
jgi:hypothetical protein